MKKTNQVEDKRFLKKRDSNYKFAENIGKKKKKISIFNLDSDEEVQQDIKLTHKGIFSLISKAARR